MKVYRKWLPLVFFLCASVSLGLISAVATQAQVKPIYDRGTTGLVQALKRLNTTASALMIGAHPDDEDTALLAYLARGESARTAYLSLTRGDGGQNIIGPELGEALGVIRTEELLQARRLDGAEQFFTRAYDYGFSKTFAEAKQKWDEKIILCDTVRVIRNFRPLVVISQFTGTPADGHGQHQFAGYLAPLAVKAAADATRCTDAGAAWKVQKFYVRHGFRATGEPKLKINTGKYDPLLGRSYFEIAMEARSQHKSQEQGVMELKGDQFSGLNLVESNISKTEKERSIFDGLDILTSSYLKPQVSNAAAKALRDFQPWDSKAILPSLLDGYSANLQHSSELFRSLVDVDGVPLVSMAERTEAASKFAIVEAMDKEFVEAILLAAGIRVDVLADRETAIAGDELLASVRFFYPPEQKVSLHDFRFTVPFVAVNSVAAQENTSPLRREVPSVEADFKLSIPKDYLPTQPYWLVEQRNGEIYSSTSPYPEVRPFQDPTLEAFITILLDGKKVYLKSPVEFRYADDIRGEIRRNVDVVPRVSIEMEQSLMIVPRSDKEQTRQIVMTVTNHSKQSVSGVVGLNINAPNEWKYLASSKSFDIKRTGEKATMVFDVTIPAGTKAGSYQISGNAMVGEALATSTMLTIAYPHIQTHRFYQRAVVDVRVMELKTTPVKVGYITGSGDRVPEAIRQMGFELEVISERDLAGGNLSRFDVIVVGIRAYQVRPDVVAANTRLLDYARGGGTLIVQYQLPGYVQQGLTPFPTQMGPRVSDENSAVKMLVPDHSVFNFPNKITDADFTGWVQERNLYNFTNADAAYVGLLESHDAGEVENNGGLMIAKLGKGNYVYCSYSLFRQLPAGVPGAYRLLANLLSLPKVAR